MGRARGRGARARRRPKKGVGDDDLGLKALFHRKRKNNTYIYMRKCEMPCALFFPNYKACNLRLPIVDAAFSDAFS